MTKPYPMLLTIAFLILFVPSLLLFYGFYRFQSNIQKEREQYFNTFGKTEKQVTKRDLEGFPVVMQHYLLKTGLVGKCKDCHAIFKQTGRIKTDQKKDWTRFTATQYMAANYPSFIWSAKSFPIFIRDKSIDGHGEVKISFFGLKDTPSPNSAATDKSALARALGELAFYPQGFLSEHLSWEELDATSVKAKAEVNGIKTEGIFHFDQDGLIERFQAKRYMGDSLENFTGHIENYRSISGMLLPTKMRAVWNLKDGDFEYFVADIMDYRLE